jgi:hypothetical protein
MQQEEGASARRRFAARCCPQHLLKIGKQIIRLLDLRISQLVSQQLTPRDVRFGAMAICSQIYLSVTIDIRERRQRSWPKLGRPIRGFRRPEPSAPVKSAEQFAELAAPSPPFRSWFCRIRDRRFSPAFCCASNPSPSRNQPSNWWQRAQRSVNKIVATISEPCVFTRLLPLFAIGRRCKRVCDRLSPRRPPPSGSSGFCP